MNRREAYDNVVVVSVPHTGTHTITAALHCNYIHFHDVALPWSYVSLDKFVEGKVFVCPLRDPADVWASWVAREESRFALRRELFDWNWVLLREISARYDIHYIPVDRPDMRDECLLSLSGRVGRDLHTSWGRLNHHESNKSPPTRDLSWIYDIDIVRSLYGVQQERPRTTIGAYK